MNGEIKFFDGTSWIAFQTYSQVEMKSEDVHALEWVRKKMQQEAELEKLAHEHPTIADLCQELKTVQEKLQVAVALCK